MKTLNFIMAFLLLSICTSAQKYATRTGYVRFFSETPMENIEAITNQASCIADIGTGEVVSKILISSFQFEKGLMQEHFNENYMESDKFPQATIKAKVSNAIDYNSTKNQEVVLQGDLTIHGVTQLVTIKGNLVRKDKKLEVTSTFVVKALDYNIKIPKAVVNNIAKEIEVSLKFELEPLAK